MFQQWISRKLQSKVAVAAVSVAVTFAAVATIAYATDNNNTIHACVSTAGSQAQAKNMQGGGNVGSVRIVDAPEQCRVGEVLVEWNKVGQQGPPGLDGADGLNCWDLNGNGVADATEDVNSDTVVDVLDCKGPQGLKGDLGPQGPPGPIPVTNVEKYGFVSTIPPTSDVVDVPGVVISRETGDAAFFVEFIGITSVRCPHGTITLRLVRDGNVVSGTQQVVAPGSDWHPFSLLDAGTVSAGTHSWQLVGHFDHAPDVDPNCVMIVSSNAVFMEFRQ